MKNKNEIEHDSFFLAQTILPELSKIVVKIVMKNVQLNLSLALEMNQMARYNIWKVFI